MPHIFISYRRADNAATVERIDEHLERAFGAENVFFDQNDIPYGTDFPDHLTQEIERCDVMLVIIGPAWLSLLRERQDRPETDWVRREVETGLAQRDRRGITMIPLLIAGGSVPGTSDLPDSLQPLARLNALPVRSGRDFSRDMADLIAAIRPPEAETRRTLPRRGLAAARLALALTVIAALLVKPLPSVRHIPDEMADLARLTPENPDPAYDDALKLYQAGNYPGAAAALLLLERPPQTEAGLREQAEVAFLKANTLLLMQDYDAAENAFSAVLSYSSELSDRYLRQKAVYNRGIARMNRARAESFSTPDFYALVESAVGDFSTVIDDPDTDANLRALAYVNRGMAGIYYRFIPPVADGSLIKPGEDCSQPAVYAASAGIRAMGITCLAAIETFRLVEAWNVSTDQAAYCQSLDVSEPLRQLDSAIISAPQLADPHLLYGMLRLREYECARHDNQKRDDAVAHFERYLDLMATQTSILALEWDWVKYTACNSLRTYAVRSHSLCPAN